MANFLAALVRRRPESSSSFSSTQLSDITEDVEFPRRTWPRIQAVLTDEEDVEILKASVKRWLGELRDVASDAEDVLDEYEYELMTATNPTPPPSGDKKVSLSEPSSVISSSFLDGMARKVPSIRERLDEIATQREGLHLREGDGVRRVQVAPRPPSTHFVRQARVVCRDRDGEDLIKLLLMFSSGETDHKSDLAVVALVGMGGVGKTTLAQPVYNDPKVQGKFNSRGWVCASEDFDVMKLTKLAIMSVSGRGSDNTELSVFQEKLMRVLNGRKFLFVIDDVWNESLDLWETFLIPFKFGAKGSRILITTRTRRVAEITRPIAT